MPLLASFGWIDRILADKATRLWNSLSSRYFNSSNLNDSLEISDSRDKVKSMSKITLTQDEDSIVPPPAPETNFDDFEEQKDTSTNIERYTGALEVTAVEDPVS